MVESTEDGRLAVATVVAEALVDRWWYGPEQTYGELAAVAGEWATDDALAAWLAQPTVAVPNLAEAVEIDVVRPVAVDSDLIVVEFSYHRLDDPDSTLKLFVEVSFELDPPKVVLVG